MQHGSKLIGLFNRIPYPAWYEEYLTNEDSLIAIKEVYTMNHNKMVTSKWPSPLYRTFEKGNLRISRISFVKKDKSRFRLPL